MILCRPRKSCTRPNSPRRVAYHPLTVDKVDLRERKVGQPSLQVSGVQADVQRAPERVYQSRGSVLERQALEAGDAGRLGDDLGVVWDGAGDGVPHHTISLMSPLHGVDAARRLWADEVSGCFLHYDLPGESFRHHAPAKWEEQGYAITSLNTNVPLFWVSQKYIYIEDAFSEKHSLE